ncbi:prostaglandin E synthase 3-like [Ylistrum balloti]|uniref:prostaglandin E synthase 3-like n=1 Tax=Ylistrum balloti TaxID=509963 RepID=UPI002905DF38|nr:prostaglandin E synthase 3-like [Ylistrum balloti]
MASKSNKMADTSSKPLHAAVVWAQRKDKIYLTINLEDGSDTKIEINENSFYFGGKGGPEKKDYEVKIDFYKEVIPSDSKYKVLPRNVPCVIKKKDDGEFWPRLTKDAKKVHWIKTDFAKWKDEDESDYEEDSPMDLEQMMQNMGGMGGNMGEGMDAKEEDGMSEDSDDDDLPDLE